MSLKESLQNWTDVDYAAYLPGKILGITPEQGLCDFATTYKWLYRANNINGMKTLNFRARKSNRLVYASVLLRKAK